MDEIVSHKECMLESNCYAKSIRFTVRPWFPGQLLFFLLQRSPPHCRMRFTSVFEKPQVKRGLSSTVVYANLALLAVFARVVAPRLLAADNLDEFFEAVEPLGVPDRASLMGILQSIADYDTALKITLYIAAFIVEKLLMLTEFLPIQIALKTLAPIIFGGLVQGALASATTETIAACCNFIIGRNFFKV
ncbi:unnamed protein product [Durusdinium trenchii]|uniref:Uncharacterized protein n=2 Tax=Durusdinium trenchii TaxID=1381693 RepID=A0ABP0QRK9_9DINO